MEQFAQWHIGGYCAAAANLNKRLGIITVMCCRGLAARTSSLGVCFILNMTCIGAAAQSTRVLPQQLHESIVRRIHVLMVTCIVRPTEADGSVTRTRVSKSFVGV